MVQKLSNYDLRIDKRFTLKENQLKRSDPDDSVACWFGPSVEEASRLFSEDQRRDAAATLNRHPHTESERFKCAARDDLIKRDRANLDIFWLEDKSLEESDRLPILSL